MYCQLNAGKCVSPSSLSATTLLNLNFEPHPTSWVTQPLGNCSRMLLVDYDSVRAVNVSINQPRNPLTATCRAAHASLQLLGITL
jgi:hypothetical protein